VPYSSSMCLNFYHKWRSQTWKSLRQGWGDLWILPFRAKRIRCVWGKTTFSGICELCASF